MALPFMIPLFTPRGLLTSLLAIGIGTTSAQSPQPMPGYGPATAATQRRIESDAIALPSAVNAASSHLHTTDGQVPGFRPWRRVPDNGTSDWPGMARVG